MAASPLIFAECHEILKVLFYLMVFIDDVIMLWCVGIRYVQYVLLGGTLCVYDVVVNYLRKFLILSLNVIIDIS